MLRCLRGSRRTLDFFGSPQLGSQSAAVKSAPDSDEGMSRHTPEHESAIAVGSTSKSRDQYLGVLPPEHLEWQLLTEISGFEYCSLRSRKQLVSIYGWAGYTASRVESKASGASMRCTSEQRENVLLLVCSLRDRQNLKARESYKIVLISIEQRKSFRVETIRGWPRADL